MESQRKVSFERHSTMCDYVMQRVQVCIAWPLTRDYNYADYEASAVPVLGGVRRDAGFGRRGASEGPKVEW